MWSGARLSAHSDSTSPGWWRAAGIPKASQAQLAKYCTPATAHPVLAGDAGEGRGHADSGAIGLEHEEAVPSQGLVGRPNLRQWCADDLGDHRLGRWRAVFGGQAIDGELDGGREVHCDHTW